MVNFKIKTLKIKLKNYVKSISCLGLIYIWIYFLAAFSFWDWWLLNSLQWKMIIPIYLLDIEKHMIYSLQWEFIIPFFFLIESRTMLNKSCMQVCWLTHASKTNTSRKCLLSQDVRIHNSLMRYHINHEIPFLVTGRGSRQVNISKAISLPKKNKKEEKWQ